MSVDAVSPSGFQVHFPDGDDQTTSLLGLWETVPPPPTMTEFGLPGAPGRTVGVSADVPEWRVSLPSEARRAGAMLSDAQAILRVTQAALPEALRRIDQFGRAAAVATSFDTSGGAVARSEAELVELLSGYGADISSDRDGQPGSVWRRLIAEFRGTLARLRMALAPCALVRTYAGDRCVGVTAVRRPGGVATVSCSKPGLEAGLHTSAVATVLASHAALVRTFAVAVRGAAIVTTALATPLGPFLALPAAWQLVQTVQAEARRRRPLDT